MLKMDWVCSDSWKGPTSQSGFYLGALFGTVIFGYVNDHHGRLMAFLVSNFIIMLAGMATPLCTSFYSFAAMRFCQGLAFDTVFTSLLVLG